MPAVVVEVVAAEEVEVEVEVVEEVVVAKVSQVPAGHPAAVSRQNPGHHRAQ